MPDTPCADHIVLDDDTYECGNCEAEQRPVCLQWFADYDCFQEHLEAGE